MDGAAGSSTWAAAEEASGTYVDSIEGASSTRRRLNDYDDNSTVGGSSTGWGGGSGTYAGEMDRSSSRRQRHHDYDSHSNEGSSRQAPSQSGMSSSTGRRAAAAVSGAGRQGHTVPTGHSRNAGHFRDTSRSQQTNAVTRLQGLFAPQGGEEGPDANKVAEAVLKRREKRLGQTSAVPSRSDTTKVTSRGERRNDGDPGGSLPRSHGRSPEPRSTSFLDTGRPKVVRTLSSQNVEMEKIDPSPSSLARIEKFKQYMTLHTAYIQLSTSRPQDRRHNPARALRNKRLRFINNTMQPELAPWEDPESVKKWVEVTVQVPEDKDMPLPPMPTRPAVSQVNPRTRKPWVIAPEEMLADYHWTRLKEKEERERKRQQEEENERKRQEEERIRIQVSPPSDPPSRRSTSVDRGYDRSPRSSFQSAIEDRRMYKSTSRDYAQPTSYEIKTQQSFGPMTVEPEDGYASSEEEGSESEDEDSSIAVAKKRKPAAIDTQRKGPFKQLASKVSPRKKNHSRMPSAAEAEQQNLKKQEKEEKKWMASSVAQSAGSQDVMPEYRADDDSDSDSYDGEEEEYSAVAPTGKPRSGAGYGSVMIPSIAMDLKPPPKRVEPKKDSLLRPQTKLSGGTVGRSSFEEDDFVAGLSSLSREATKLPPIDPAGESAQDTDGVTNSKFLSGVTLRRKNISMTKLSPDNAAAPGTGERLLHFKAATRKAKQIVGDRAGKVKEGFSKVEERLRGREGGDSVASSSYASSINNSDHEVDSKERVSRPPVRQHISMPAAPAVVSGPRPLPPLPTINDPLEVSADEGNGKIRKRIEPPTRPNLLIPPQDRQARSREPSPLRPSRNESFSEQQRRLEHERSTAATSTLHYVFKANARLNEVVKTPKAGEYSVSTKPMAINRKQLEYARILMFSTGIVARGLSDDAPPGRNPCISQTMNPRTLASWHKEQQLRAADMTKDINTYNNDLQSKAQTLREIKVPDYHEQIVTLQSEITSNLTPLVRQTTDKADALNTELATTKTLELKTLEEELVKFTRKRRRRAGRIVRRGWFLLLEWTVVGFMWWLWMIVVIARVFRTLFRGVWKGVRWILWL